MPGGLASWLDDTSSQPHVPRRNAGSADRRASPSAIDEAAPVPSRTGRQGPVLTLTPDSAEKEAWDPFGSDCREDAFSRLLSAANRPARSSTTATAASTPCLPAAAASSSWDPFASTGDGKENRGNALSKLLASPSQPNSSSKGRSGPSSAKRKRPAVGSTLLNAAAAAGGGRGEAGNAEAVTRFCECPVCGKRVLIELCSKHLDTECNGVDATPTAATEAARSPFSAATDSRGVAGPIPPATPPPLPPPPPLAAVSSRSVLASPPPEEGKDDDDGRARTAVRAAKGVPRGQGQTSGDGASAEDDASSSRAAATTFPAPAVAPAFVSAAAAAAKPAASSRSRKLGRKRGAAAAMAMTTCPVCGQQVQADLCSLHLDTDCPGVKHSGGGRKEEVRDEAGPGTGGEEDSGKAVPKKDAGSEAAGGLTALAAELTCPICHRFCLECILGCFKSSKRQECPLCKIPAWKRDLTRDVSIQNIIAAYRRMAASQHLPRCVG